MNKVIKQFLKLKLLIIINIFFCNVYINNAFGIENFIVTTVNKIPITKQDVISRAKLLLFSVENKSDFKNLKNYYNQSLNSLINEKIILSAGLKINKNIIEMVAPKANQLLLNEFNNSQPRLKKFINKLSISKTKLLEKYESELMWGFILKNRFNKQFAKLEEIVKNKLEKNKIRQAEDLYDLAEIVISKNNNKILLNQIKTALNRGVSFLELAKEISISSSSKFQGKIGWRNYQSLPNYIKTKKINLNEGDVISFAKNDEIKIIKVLAKRINGKFSKKELGVIIAQIKFPINFQKKEDAYNEVKNKLKNLFSNRKNCKNFNLLRKQNKNYTINIIKSRIADLSSKIQLVIRNIGQYEMSQPIFFGNNGYAYIICDTKKPRSEKELTLELKNKFMQKHYLILSERYLKRLYKEANISNIKKLDK